MESHSYIKTPINELMNRNPDKKKIESVNSFSSISDQSFKDANKPQISLSESYIVTTKDYGINIKLRKKPDNLK